MNSTPISVEEALRLIKTPDAGMLPLIARADRVRRENFGNKINLCSIINAKSGNCGENCKFCPQSIYSASNIERYPLLSKEQLLKSAHEAADNKVENFSIVTSGRAISATAEQESLTATVAAIASQTTLAPCASLGTIDEPFLRRLKEAGLDSYHHNLEAAESFYPNICTTRSFADNVATIKAAKKLGLRVCSGGLFGMGETPAQRVELFATLRELEVDSVPLNFLNPIEGTPLKAELKQTLTPFDCLRIIAVARLMMPGTTIRICGGREYNLREMQSWIFAAGANAMMVGCYLTTKGRKPADDIRMLHDAGMELAQ